MESARRWSGFVCPDCRFVFRVPRDHDGKGIVCPSCRRILRIPEAGDVTPPLIVSVRDVAAQVSMEPEPVDSDDAPDEEIPEAARRKRRGKHGSEVLSWDADSSGRRRSRASERRRMGWFFAVGLVMFATLIGALVLVLQTGSGQADAQPPLAGLGTPASSDAAADEFAAADEAGLPSIMRRSEVSLLAEAEPLARRFLEAASVEEMLPLVRNPEVAGPRMLEFYPQGRIEPPGLSVFNASGAPNYRSAIVSVDLLTDEHETRQLAFVETDDGLKVDWESFAGWSEMPWDEFIAQRTTEPRLFRVILRVLEYYNFDFTDEAFWQSYRLESPDGEHILFGYAERGSLLQQQLRPDVAKSSVAATLILKFPEGAASDNQVIIERFVADGWIED